MANSPLKSIANRHTERYLSFDSHHPVAHKRAVVKSLTDRAKTIPSSVDQQSKEMNETCDRGTQGEWLPETGFVIKGALSSVSLQKLKSPKTYGNYE